ncbi:hypothetical protein QE152_g31035 [Popillia japonica]|uniref:Retrotransposon gag domain-containing protein n=1 Tax=Popillia japonica TaxID=7064 RepID=A0AAW1JCN0_POPJA
MRIADSHLEYVKDQHTAFDMWNILSTTFERKSIANQLLLKDQHTAFDMWNILSTTFERKSIANQLLLRKRLLTMKLNSGIETLESHFLKFDNTIRELKLAGATTLSFVKNRLLDEQIKWLNSKKDAGKHSTIPAAFTTPTKTLFQNKGQGEFKFKCYNFYNTYKNAFSK